MDTAVNIHRITLKHRSESEEKCLMIPLVGEEKHMAHILQDFIKRLPLEVQLQEGEQPEEEKKIQKELLYHSDPELEDDGANVYLAGLIKVAIDGYEATYKHPKTGEEFNRTPEHFEYRPYFFMLAIPKKERFGLCFLQKISRYSISGLFYMNFHGYFQSLF